MAIFYKYRVYDPIRRRWYTSCHMTEADAVARYPEVPHERLDYTREERGGDWRDTLTGGFLKGSGRAPD